MQASGEERQAFDRRSMQVELRGFVHALSVESLRSTSPTCWQSPTMLVWRCGCSMKIGRKDPASLAHYGVFLAFQDEPLPRGKST